MEVWLILGFFYGSLAILGFFYGSLTIPGFFYRSLAILGFIRVSVNASECSSSFWNVSDSHCLLPGAR
jgi:hypothetical protein